MARVLDTSNTSIVVIVRAVLGAMRMTAKNLRLRKPCETS